MFTGMQVLLALERIEQYEDLTYEVVPCFLICCFFFSSFQLNEVFFILQQLLVLETNLLFGGLTFHDQHSDMRMDIDNMSYEVWAIL